MTSTAANEIDVKPSTAPWFFFKHSQLEHLPHYWNIESADYYEGTGFSISGYIHDDDVARLVLAANSHHAMKEALRELLDAFDASPDDLDAMEYVAIVADAKSRARAALSRLTKEI